MEEKELIKSNMSYLKKIKRACLVIVCIAVLLWVWFFIYQELYYYGLSDFDKKFYSLYFRIFKSWPNLTFTGVQTVGISAIAFSAVAIFSLVYYLYCSKMDLVVTNKRIYGKTSFGRRVDLPLDMISAVGTKAFNGITVSTSSGIIKFLGISNQEEVHKAITDLLMERQDNPKQTMQIKQEIPQSNADELKKFKELLDSGIITQEEFDAKKKQLLGL